MEGSSRENRKIKGILRKTWERCKSFGHIKTDDHLQVWAPSLSPQHVHQSLPPPAGPLMTKSKSWSSSFSLCPPSPRLMMDKRVMGRSRSKKPRVDSPVVPHGCFSVYVGPEKQRFVMKVGWTSHPLFRMLLEEAELEYGFHSEGPLVLPCDVDVFIKVLFEMEADDHDNQEDHVRPLGCGFPRSNSLSYQPLSPSAASTLVSLNLNRLV